MDISFIFFYVIINLIPPHINHCEIKYPSEKPVVIERVEDFWLISIPTSNGVDNRRVHIKHNLYIVLPDSTHSHLEHNYDLHDFLNIKKVNWQKTDKIEVTKGLPIKAFWIERQENLYKIRVETESGEDKNLEMSF